MNDKRVLVTKDIRDSKEEEINNELERLKQERDTLLEKEPNVKVALKINRKLFREAKRKYKLQKKKEIKAHKAILKAEKERYKAALEEIYIPLADSRKELDEAIKNKNEFNAALSGVRGDIAYLQKEKELINDMYISEKDEYIDIDDLPKSK